VSEASGPETPVEKHLARDTVALLTPIPNGKVLASICAINGIKGQVIETSAGAFAVLDDTSEGSTDTAGHAISAFVKDRPILALERRAGQVTIRRWLAGTQGDSLPPGLALDQAPGAITTLMMGTQTIEELALTHPDKVYSASMSRFSAFRSLRKLAKQAKKEAGKS
jgi:hypothetical protein